MSTIRQFGKLLFFTVDEVICVVYNAIEEHLTQFRLDLIGIDKKLARYLKSSKFVRVKK